MNKPVKFAIIADPHYYSEKLGNSGSAYEMRANSDQKMLAHSKSVILAALDEIKNSDAEFLLIAGDLTNEGERVSHEEMRDVLYEFKKHMPVYVITATHDWCSSGKPKRFEGDSFFTDVETLKPEELRDFYEDFGPNEALSEYFTHQHKASYVIRPAEGVTVFCLDDDQDGNGGSGYSEEHFDWIKTEVENAKKRGDVFFGMQHHHVFLTELDRVINGKGAVERKEKMCRNFADIDFSVMFTGHSHMHHIRRLENENGKHFYEFNIASISGYPAPIVYCTVTNEGINTETEFLKQYEYNGITYSNDHLKNHATFLFKNVIDAAKQNSKLEFITVLVAIGVSEKTAKKLWFFLGWLVKAIGNMSVYKAAKILNFFTFGKAVPKEAAKQLKNVQLTDMIFSAFLSILDGSIEKHDVNSPYYKVFTAALSLPLRIVKALRIKNEGILRILTHISNASHEIMTGGEIDASKAMLYFQTAPEEAMV